MKEPKIVVTIDAEGNAKLQTQGLAGPACQEFSKALEGALGVVVSDEPTAEMHERDYENARTYQY